ncbi:MAG: hypothetical protein MJE77_42275 [Proteobacteria bacterium]|nr:hypothetical protein [Pseudomonadota bacterium]
MSSPAPARAPHLSQVPAMPSFLAVVLAARRAASGDSLSAGRWGRKRPLTPGNAAAPTRGHNGSGGTKVARNALAVARAGAVLNHWLRTIASLHSHEAGIGPLTLGEIFERVQRTNQDSRQSMLSKTKPNNALSRPAHTI